MKKLLALLLVCTMVLCCFALASCENDPAGNKSGDASTDASADNSLTPPSNVESLPLEDVSAKAAVSGFVTKLAAQEMPEAPKFIAELGTKMTAIVGQFKLNKLESSGTSLIPGAISIEGAGKFDTTNGEGAVNLAIGEASVPVDIKLVEGDLYAGIKNVLDNAFIPLGMLMPETPDLDVAEAVTETLDYADIEYLYNVIGEYAIAAIEAIPEDKFVESESGFVLTVDHALFMTVMTAIKDKATADTELLAFIDEVAGEGESQKFLTALTADADDQSTAAVVITYTTADRKAEIVLSDEEDEDVNATMVFDLSENFDAETLVGEALFTFESNGDTLDCNYSFDGTVYDISMSVNSKEVKFTLTFSGNQDEGDFGFEMTQYANVSMDTDDYVAVSKIGFTAGVKDGKFSLDMSVESATYDEDYNVTGLAPVAVAEFDGTVTETKADFAGKFTITVDEQGTTISFPINLSGSLEIADTKVGGEIKVTASIMGLDIDAEISLSAEQTDTITVEAPAKLATMDENLPNQLMAEVGEKYPEFFTSLMTIIQTFMPAEEY